MQESSKFRNNLTEFDEFPNSKTGCQRPLDKQNSKPRSPTCRPTLPCRLRQQHLHNRKRRVAANGVDQHLSKHRSRIFAEHCLVPNLQSKNRRDIRCERSARMPCPINAACTLADQITPGLRRSAADTGQCQSRQEPHVAGGVWPRENVRHNSSPRQIDQRVGAVPRRLPANQQPQAAGNQQHAAANGRRPEWRQCERHDDCCQDPRKCESSQCRRTIPSAARIRNLFNSALGRLQADPRTGPARDALDDETLPD